MKSSGHVIIRGQVFRWEEKAPFVASGKSVLGAIEYDRAADRLRCHECGGWFTNLAIHTRKHFASVRDYKRQHGLRLHASLVTPTLRAKFSKVAKRLISTEAEAWTKDSIGKRLAACRANRTEFPKKQTDESRNVNGSCDAQLTFRIQRLAAKLGRVPARSDAEEHDKGLVSACMKHGGGWRDAVLKAGIPAMEHGRRLSDHILIEALRDFYVLNRRFPRTREFGRDRLANQETYKSHFGSMERAYAAAGLAWRYAELKRGKDGRVLPMQQAGAA